MKIYNRERDPILRLYLQLCHELSEIVCVLFEAVFEKGGEATPYPGFMVERNEQRTVDLTSIDNVRLDW